MSLTSRCRITGLADEQSRCWGNDDPFLLGIGSDRFSHEADSLRAIGRFVASLQVSLNLSPDFAICASNQFHYGAESDATERTSVERITKAVKATCAP